MFFRRRRSFLNPALRATTPDAPKRGAAAASATPTRTSRNFQILLVARITNISEIDLYVFRRNINKSIKKL